jgi:hypothetical protein
MPNFKRAVRLEVTAGASSPFATPSSSGSAVAPITDLRVAFEVENNDGVNLNHAIISIYNLNPSDRAAFALPMPMGKDLRFLPLPGDSVSVRLFAGYEDNPEFIFEGDVKWSHSDRIGPDWVTRLELYAGLRASIIPSQVSFVSPTPARTVLESILAPLGISLEYTDFASAILTGPPEKKVTTFSSSGLAYRDADDLCSRWGLAFTLERQRHGLIYAPNQPRDATAKNPRNTISPTSGLIGTPKITPPGIEVKCLLRPDMRIMQRFFVESETTRGSLQATNYAPDYYAANVRHIGDTRGEEWFTEIEGYYARMALP